MKIKYSVGIVTIGLALAATLFAAEQEPTKDGTKAIWLKFRGKNIAELRLLKGETFEITTGDDRTNGVTKIDYDYDVKTSHMTSQTGFTIQIRGDNIIFPITIKADEIEFVKKGE